ncbi:MAG: DUF881 domain-containing protein [Actinomycetia bacterium]|nr:DUF881 domain-containing protein [Actinomycetes bacterium]
MRSTLVWRVLVPVVLLLIGLLLATSARLAAGTDLRAERRTDLVDLIRAEQARVEAKTSTVSELQDQLDAAANAEVPAATDPELEALISQVDGPGLTVTLEDAPIPADGVPDGYNAEDYIVHEQDVQAVINALWAGGAEAIGVMDQRLIATSAVRCVGSTLLLHGQVYAPPYTVTAVGPTDRLQRALDVSPRVAVYRQYADLLGLGFDVSESDAVTVPAYEGPLAAQLAQVVE